MGLYNSLAIPRFPITSIPWSATSKKSSLAAVLLTVALLPAVYSAYILRLNTRRTTAAASISPPDPLVSASLGKDDEAALDRIPPDVRAALDQHVVARERVLSEAVPLRSILPGLREQLEEEEYEYEKGMDGRGGRRGLLETYLAATMRTFTWTPQALAMKVMVSRLPDGAALAETFSAAYLDVCRFEAGDRVCGVYVVRERVRSGRGGERVFLDLSAPEGWTGPVVHGVLDCGFVLGQERGEGVVRFVNETLLWRGKEEKPTLFEGAVSRWLHTAMVRWMMVRGVEAVTGSEGRTKVEVT
ncbi:hypothetical protein F5Y12DRAFT_765760 [Xylaria sp. FL1777]|nr:hypothetical protein F5Y12DRAFT_765760 [Xylaria sp. FL1777]